MSPDIDERDLQAAADLARETCACFALRHAARQTTRLFETELSQAGLSPGQFSILSALVLHEEIAFSDLAERLGMERTSLSRALRPLARDGHITLSPEGPRRRRSAKITEAGRKTYAGAFPLWQRAQAKAARQFGPQAWPELADRLSKLSETQT
ncbi:MarR family winged helix-turn-helix transcriptional regulator [Algihabitans albus]|uniref:MarR family winged helix-turn-helix transcriptional regulator n=1 Tax=Algihabitans albus TaxID=2164067 RepID=UPI0013C2DBC5|nr:MarR family winged helix-turn-helix transcriptional regulator [Algihabitans albus]